MNNNLTTAVKQTISTQSNENLIRDLRRAIKVINAEYQQIDWEDQAFLNSVLTDVLEVIEANEAK